VDKIDDISFSDAHAACRALDAYNRANTPPTKGSR
jgi:hypothetical protein